MKVHKQSQFDNVVARNQTVWVGLDVHQKTTEVLVLGAEEVLHREGIPTERKHFVALAEQFENCEIHAVYEASSVGYKPLRWLREAGFKAFMTPPALIPTRKGEFVKTDKRDALKLARCLRGQMLDPVWDLTDRQYADRQLVRARKQLVRHRSGICQQIKSLLTFHGIEKPRGLKANWSNAYLEWLTSEPTGQKPLDQCLESLVRMYQQLTVEIDGLMREIEVLADTRRYKKRVNKLKTAPGVGVLVAMTFLVELGPVLERFENCKQLASYLGLVPSENSSGSRTNKGGLPRRGNAWIRTELVQAAWKAIGKDDRLGSVYRRIRARNGDHGAGVAIVAVARRLGLALRAILEQDDGSWDADGGPNHNKDNQHEQS